MSSTQLAVLAVALVFGAGCSARGAPTDAARSDGREESDAPTVTDALTGIDGPLPTDGPAGDDRLFVPVGLPNTNEDGQDDGLILIAFTLVSGPTGPSFYAAVQNVWSTPLCEAGMMITFYDQSGQMLGSGASVLQSGRFYELTDGSGAIITCVDPGQIAMTGEIGLADTIVVDQVGSMQHLFPSFNVSVTPVGGLTVGGLKSVASAAGTAYTGTVVNDIGSTLSNPTVSVFPVNQAGRPLGMATASLSTDLAAGATWTFQTGTVDDPGVGQVAYASGSVP